ncbi:MAG: M48 family metalloprotease [Candidatus Omnitrophica bacterium]|nr:M48 family metalloprotease [Candidatus Omnitrophota bacterium]MBD3269616.1 M48 family metalloprotease [Candidatus Omnitrophota bacterium]
MRYILIPKVLTFVLGASISAGCVTTEYNVGTHTQDIYFYSTESEINMGRNIAKKIKSEFEVSSNPYDIKRVDSVVRKILPFIDRQELSYYFYILDSDDKGKEQINAFSVPGGYVYIFKDLLDMLDEDELAFVLAHEVGHIVSRHHIKRLQAVMGSNLLLIASKAAPSDSNFSGGLSFALAQIISGYSRQDEFNADELAVEYCESAGFDPRAGIEVLEKLYNYEKENLRPVSYFRTHPYTDQRIRHIKETLQLSLDVDDYINY